MSTSTYDEIAEWYDGWVGSDAMREDPFFPAVEALMGEVAGRRVCDLACGQGRVARYLAAMGASVTGIDLSERLLDFARRREAEEPQEIEYLHGDARELAGVAGDSFDIVVCHMALMDIPDLDPTLRSVARILRPSGRFVFSIIHPCYNPPRSGEMATEDGVVRTVRGYWEEGYWRSDARTGPPGKVGAYHRTLSTYVNALTDAGLMVERMSEPQATGALAARRTVWGEVPAMLAVQCRKAPSRYTSGSAGYPNIRISVAGRWPVGRRVRQTALSDAERLMGLGGEAADAPLDLGALPVGLAVKAARDGFASRARGRRGAGAGRAGRRSPRRRQSRRSPRAGR